METLKIAVLSVLNILGGTRNMRPSKTIQMSHTTEFLRQKDFCNVKLHKLEKDYLALF